MILLVGICTNIINIQRWWFHTSICQRVMFESWGMVHRHPLSSIQHPLEDPGFFGGFVACSPEKNNLGRYILRYSCWPFRAKRGANLSKGIDHSSNWHARRLGFGQEQCHSWFGCCPQGAATPGHVLAFAELAPPWATKPCQAFTIQLVGGSYQSNFCLQG